MRRVHLPRQAMYVCLTVGETLDTTIYIVLRTTERLRSYEQKKCQRNQEVVVLRSFHTYFVLVHILESVKLQGSRSQWFQSASKLLEPLLLSESSVTESPSELK